MEKISITPPESASRQPAALTHADLLKLKRWNTCSVANAIEQISRDDPLNMVNREETRDFMPEIGSMVGVAMTVQITGSEPAIKRAQPENFSRYREYLASVEGPKIVVVQDLDSPACHGALWGEVGANTARTLNCVGTITDGAVRDLDEMRNAGFKAIARRLCVSHGHVWPVRWGCEVTVFGTRVQPGQLVHADKHGFILIPKDAQARVLEAARFMDDLECRTLIPASRQQAGRPMKEILQGMEDAAARFREGARDRYGNSGEW